MLVFADTRFTLPQPFSLNDSGQKSESKATTTGGDTMPLERPPLLTSTTRTDQKPFLKAEGSMSEDKKDVKMEVSRYESLRYVFPSVGDSDRSKRHCPRADAKASFNFSRRRATGTFLSLLSDSRSQTQKVTRLQETNTSQAETIKGLLEEKTKLQTTLGAEQEALSKLKFEVMALTTLCDRLKVVQCHNYTDDEQVEVTKFDKLVSTFESDRKRLGQKQRVVLLLYFFNIGRNYLKNKKANQIPYLC
jgi:hypothetical protein